MKKILPFILLIISQFGYSQPNGNEWINYNQSYFPFKIAEDGIYRINYQDLINSNIPLASINPKNFQVFARGKEIPIYVQGESDNVFNVNDYIEFYGEANDGWLDSVFYKGRDKQPNPHYSLLNDTIYYYLTYNSSQTNRRIQEETAIDFGNYFPASFIWKEEIYSYSSNYYDGKTLFGNATDPEYDETEGWMHSSVSLGKRKDYSLSFKNRYQSGPFIKLEIFYSGQSNWAFRNDGDHHIRVEVGGNQVDDIFEGYKLRSLSTSFSPSQVVSGNHTLTYRSIDDRNVDVDRSAVSFIKYSYPHTLVLNNATEFSFQLDDHASQNAQYIDLINFRGGNNPILYDLTNSKRIRVIQTLSTYRALVPNGSGRKSCLIAAESEIKTVKLESLTNNRFLNYLTLDLDSAFLMLTHHSLYPEATRYANYRASKGYSPIIIDIDELYHQFGYGIEKNPLAIRNFVSTALDSSSPKYLFLLGKSVSHQSARKNSIAFSDNLVPSFGNPPVDNLLTSGLNGSLLEAALPTGRLSARYLIEVTNYLDKVIEYESASAALWMKKALHFAGGLSISESNRYENYLNSYESMFESNPMGGKALLFKKSTSVPIQTSLSDSIRTLINSGVSVMTFFGHASTTGGFDISIDSPDKLKNRGKYPAILANSCYSGNYHQSGVLSVAEQYVLEKNKGSIAFIASGNLGFPSTLNLYSSAFYRNISNLNYGKSLAENMISTVKSIQGNNPTSSIKLVCLEMSLQGDPALKLNSQPLPDYLVDQSSINVFPNEVSTELDSFQVAVNCFNLGRSTNDSIVVKLTREFPDGLLSDTSYFKVLPFVGYNNETVFNIQIDVLNSVGLNNFSLLIDPNNEIPEINETNNRVDFDVLIRSGEIIPVYPYNYAIVGEQGVKLRASTAFALEKEINYIFELDTSSSFNSLLKPTTTIMSSGGVIEWAPSLLDNMPDSLVYFWRVSRVPAQGEPFNWRTSSFQYIPNESGWSQDHFDQFDKNKYLFVAPNKTSKEFDFVANVKELYVKNIGSPTSNAQSNEIRYSIDADTRERNACGGTPGFLIAVLDSLNLDSWETPYGGLNPQNDFGQANKNDYCSPDRTRPEKFFLFRTNSPEQMDSMKVFLNQKIPDGNYIVAYSWRAINYSDIRNQDSTILKAFDNLGSSLISSLNDNIPFIFTCKKGQLNSAQEIVGSSPTDEIELRRTLTINADFGEIESVEIGSSLNYSRLSYEISSKEQNSDDQVELILNAIEQNGDLKFLMQLNSFSVDTNIASLANNNNYRGLQLNLKVEDQTSQTPPQIDRWQISYTELPEFALVPNLHLKVNSTELQQGDDLEFEIGIKNISREDSDSLLIAFQVINSLNQVINIPYERQMPISADSLFISKISISTANLIGNNKLIINVNPNKDQPEQYSFNNLGQFDFKVIGDRLNPLIDVTFDGRHILNREIISAEPEIVIQLKDENQYLALDDTSAFSVFLRYPNGNEELLNFGSSAGIMEFIPASLPNNQALARLKPRLSEDGIYAIRIQAFDKSGNASGKQDYIVEFEIVNQASITHMVNYPNPFSTSTRFVFTLTGSEIPEQIQIQIMTVTGKVVKEIDQFELGPLHIGNNISQYAWDGKDEYGDQLANGVYLYRVKAKLNGNNLDRRDSKLDSFFVKEFGKMYLLR